MEDSANCQLHGKPIQNICKCCKGFLCFKCYSLHTEKGCKEIVDLPSYAATELLPKYKARLDEFETQKDAIDQSIKDFSVSLESLRQQLFNLQEVLEQVLDNVHDTITVLSESLTLPSLSYNTQKLFVANEHQKLKDAVQRDDMGHIMKKLERPDLPNTVPVGDSEKLLVKALAQLIPPIINSKELKELNEELKELKEVHRKVSEQYVSKVVGNLVYGVCKPESDYTELCSYDIRKKKLVAEYSVPKRCTVTQVSSQVFVSGGYEVAYLFGDYDTMTDKVSEYIPKTDTLMVMKAMAHRRCEHRTETLSPTAFMAVGGFDGEKPIPHCEEFSIKDNRWTSLPSLNYPRHCFATALLNSRYVYAIGGEEAKEAIEVFDIIEKAAWRSVQLLSEDALVRKSIAAFPISAGEILILSASRSLVYSPGKGGLEESGLQLEKECYELNSPCMIEGSVYVLGELCGNVHVYKIAEREVDEHEYENIC